MEERLQNLRGQASGLGFGANFVHDFLQRTGRCCRQFLQPQPILCDRIPLQDLAEAPVF